MKFCTDVETRCPGCPIDKDSRQLRPDENLALKRALAASFVEPDHEAGGDRETHVQAIIGSLVLSEPAAWHMDSLARDITVHRVIGKCINHEGAVVDDFTPDQKDIDETRRILEKFKLIEGEE
jgi:hypothetical protein